MPGQADAKTLFHLVPLSPAANAALEVPENRPFVSRAQTGVLGLEVGFHVPKSLDGRVITRLGRSPQRADLVLHQPNIEPRLSRVHFAFEMWK
ncbi:hypothetical protein F4780DRAFT_87707 [Xylariomycetidae sp. FL0641]|nr:hypothetical protein F4780DRAFT_87707 [Xylariomycetidae sp. FL0641]